MEIQLMNTTACLKLLASTALSVLLMGGSAKAQALTEDQLASVTETVAASADALAELKAFESQLDLPDGLTQAQSDALIGELWEAYRDGMLVGGGGLAEGLGELTPTLTELIEQAERGRINIEARAMPLGEFVMPFTLIRRESQGVPEEGRPFFICTHGGGGNGSVEGPHAWGVNTREWQTQTQFAIQYYEPEGLYFVPRMADDRLGRWRHAHHQDQFEMAIRHAILFWGIDANRVYKLGISQGGFGTAILAPFMPDLFAAANPMAAGVGLGNPVENLRNLPFRTEVGENDTMFNRVGHAITFHARLDELHEADPEGYNHVLNKQPGRGHGIDYRPGVRWIAQFSRNPYPETVIWTSKLEDGRRRPSMYWIELGGDNLQGTISITATLDRETNSVALTAFQLATEAATGDPTQIGEDDTQATPLTGATVSVLLNDAMLDLDQPVTITCNGEEVFAGNVERDGDTLLETLVRRGDKNYAFPTRIVVEFE